MSSHHHSAEDCDESCRESLRDGKISLIVVLAVFTFVCSLLPWFFRRCFRQKAIDIINVLSALSGGVVFGALMSIMIPESSALFSEYLSEKYEDDLDNPYADYPYSQLLLGATFIILIFLDHIAMHFGTVHGHSHGDITVLHDDTCVPKELAVEIRDENSQVNNDSKIDTLESEEVDVNADNTHTVQATVSQDDKPAKGGPKLRNHIQLFVFAAALAVHSILDGFAIGSEQSINGFYSMLIAVLSHKGFDGLVLGVPLFLGGVSLTTSVIILFISALMTPLGIGIALAVTETALSVLPQAIVLSISAGSFLYISIIEMLPAAIRDGRLVHIKLVAFFIGWFALAIIAGFGHNHAHGHHDDDHDHDHDHDHDGG